MDESVEVRELVWSWDLFRDQVGNALDGLRQRRTVAAFLDPSSSSHTRKTVRALYQRVLKQAVDLGMPRQAGQTPEDYLSILTQVFPGEEQALETLTRIYAVARYGIAPPTAEQAQLAVDAFGRLLDSGSPEPLAKH